MLTTRITNFIGGHEGFVSTYYLDPVHIPTIGYGFTWSSQVFRDWWLARYARKFRKGDTISKADAHQVLLAILAEEAQRPVDAKFGQIAIHVLEAAYSFVFNAGPGALKWKWAQAIMRGDLRGAAALWRVTATTAKGKNLPGLIRRRAEEADIAEFDKWPEWVVGTDAPPETHVEAIDIRQAQQWLNQLGYDCGDPDGIAGLRTVTATKRFQTDHGTLRVDGIIGPATLAALQRAIDLKGKGKVVIGGGGAVTGAGGLEQGTGTVDAAAPDAGWVGDVLLWGGLAILTIGLGYLAWRYRDELLAALEKL
jgi:lysozyme